MSRLRRFVSGLAALRDRLLPEQPNFYHLLEAAAAEVQKCTAQAQRCCSATSDAAGRHNAFETFATHRLAARRAVKAIKREVDSTFLPPINDVQSHALAEALGAVVRAVKMALRDAEFFDFPPEIEGVVEMGELILNAGKDVERGVGLLRLKKWDELTELTHSVRDLEERSDTIALAALRRLNEADLETVVEYRRLSNAQKYLSNLETVLDRCAAVAHVLQTISSGNR
ncbi:MAG: hypothetical protein U0136_16140 [Bdellovibrionota bacterium]